MTDHGDSFTDSLPSQAGPEVADAPAVRPGADPHPARRRHGGALLFYLRADRLQRSGLSFLRPAAHRPGELFLFLGHGLGGNRGGGPALQDPHPAPGPARLGHGHQLHAARPGRSGRYPDPLAQGRAGEVQDRLGPPGGGQGGAHVSARPGHARPGGRDRLLLHVSHDHGAAQHLGGDDPLRLLSRSRRSPRRGTTSARRGKG